MVRKACSYEGCGGENFARGLCQAHSAQLRRGIGLRPVRPSRPDPQPGLLWCGTCQAFVDEDLFGWDTSRNQPKRTCRPCIAEQAKAYRRRHRERINKAKTAKKFGLTIEQWDALYEEQGGRCTLCGNGRGNYHELSVDHDHDTGKIRGLLCGPCNMGIGQLRDDPELLERAAMYIREHKVNHDLLGS